MTFIHFALFLSSLEHSNVKNVRKTLRLLYFVLNAVMKKQMFDEI